MNSKFLAAATLAIALAPAIANADQIYSGGAADSASSRFVTFMTKLIVPGADKDQATRQPIAYADNPELIGHRRGSTNTVWSR
ncbi:hypothetical protein [Pleomorphomonas sp. PLEO]|uniref:hypothetical protein n=1 Tax=Pleomorphomonas sp. PLEO TaxID=3239306 RepID=UPI00351F7ABF